MSQIEVDKVIPQSGTALQVGDSGDTITIPAGATITNNGTANGFGSADTEKVKVSSNDTTAGFLNGKLVAGTNISLTEGTDGGNETLTAALTGTIGTSQIADDAITLAKMAPGTDGNIISYDASGNPVAVATGSAGQVLTSAGAGAPPIFAAGAVNGLEEADQWRLTSGISGTAGAITANLERNDTSFAYVGTGMTESSGVFTFPSTGIYLVLYTVVAYGNSQGDIRYAGGSITATTNNSSYTNLSEMYNGCNNHGATYYMCSTQQAIFDVTNVSTHKIRLQIASSSTVTFVGNTNNNTTCVTFLKLGAT